MSDRGQPSGWRRLVPISFWLTSYESGLLVSANALADTEGQAPSGG